MPVPLDVTLPLGDYVVERAFLDLRRQPTLIASCHSHAALLAVFAERAVRLSCSSCQRLVASVRLDDPSTMLLATQGMCSTAGCRAAHPVRLSCACGHAHGVVASYEAGRLILRCPTCHAVGWNLAVRDDTRFAPTLNN